METDVKELKRPLILMSVMLGMFLAAIEATIVATAMPSIVSDLGDFSLYSWVFSAYLLTSAATVLIFGKLSDIIGRRPVFTIGVMIFLAGSTLAGFSSSMVMLILARFIQGIGAGALMPIAQTIVGDIYTKEERAKIQGYLSAVWGVSAVSGPLIGGLFVEHLNWRYVFWMNIPLGILSMLGILIFLHEKVEKKRTSIDFWGSLWIVVAISTLMFILVEGGLTIAWNSTKMLLLVSLTLFALFAFMFHENRVREPMLPFELWSYRLIRIANLTSLSTGVIIIGISSYLPTFVQGVMGKSAIIAGFTLTSMSIGWPLASTIAGNLLLRIGFRKTSLIGGIFLLIGSLFFVLLSPEKGPLWAALGSFFIGIGMGMTSTSFIVAIQTTVDWEIRGIATATNMFMRSLGSAIGAALLGGLLNKQIMDHIKKANLESVLSVDSVDTLLVENNADVLSTESLNVLREGLTSGLNIVYFGILVIAIISFIMIIFIPKNDIFKANQGD